jgi:predicted unusual protein kinase regulating ubiquinone biosynthesis (AarF/ABC1/UbiB family)
VLLSRVLFGLGLIAWLAPLYLCCAAFAYFWRAPTRAWRRWLDQHGAHLFVAHARRHGALLIKIGQFIASRPDIFPLSYVDACAPLRDQAPARPFRLIEPVLKDVYEGRITDHLARIEETALAAASFGQVHRAWLADGRLVAVKVQYPELARSVAADLWLVRLTLQLISFTLRGWPLRQIYDQIARTSREEQDYLHEGTAADRLRTRLAQHGISVPQVFWAHTREKVLVMEYAQGTTLGKNTISTLTADERQRLADALIDGFLAMLLDEGFFHADPHGGNLIYDHGKLWLIDFGMTATLERREAELYRQFLDCVRNNDTDGMIDVLTELGWTLPTADRAHLKGLAREVYDSLAHLDPQTFKGSQRQAELGKKIAEFLRRMDGIIFPQHTVLLSRATSLLEGVCMELVPGKNLLDLVRPRLTRLTTVRGQIKNFISEVQALWKTYRRLPDNIEALLAKKPTAFPLLPLLSALLLIAALQLTPSIERDIAVVATAVGVILGVLFRRS